MIQKFVDIHPNAVIGEGSTISNFVTIEDNVIIGENCWIGSGAVIASGARIGNNVRIFPGAIVAAVPQDLKFGGEMSLVEIGDNTTIREYVTINRGTSAAGTTRVGKNCLVMAYCHIAHDCIVGDNCVLANNVSLAGHIEVGNFVVLGGMAAVQQFSKIGDHVMLGGYSKVRTDVPPFVKAARDPLSYAGINTIGLKRRGFDQERIHHIQDIYRILFVHGSNVKKSIENIENNIAFSADKDYILEFVKSSKRGLIKGV
jgi:UDP-N-acetylglucosamine acyltransferase